MVVVRHAETYLASEALDGEGRALSGGQSEDHTRTRDFAEQAQSSKLGERSNPRAHARGLPNLGRAGCSSRGQFSEAITRLA